MRRSGWVFWLLPFLAVAGCSQGVATPWSFRLGGGVNPVVGETEGYLDWGGHFRFDAGYRLKPKLILNGEFNYYGFGLDPKIVQQYDVPAGDAYLINFNIEPEWRLHALGSTPYLIGGVGFDDRVVRFLQPTVASTFIFDPWFGYFGPALVPADTVIGSFSSHALGLNAGVGYEWTIKQVVRARHRRYIVGPPVHVFIEGRFDYANTRGAATLFIPITVGVRF